MLEVLVLVSGSEMILKKVTAIPSSQALIAILQLVMIPTLKLMPLLPALK
jgi:hypothetical protein